MKSETANILVVDNKPNNLRLLASILTEQGYDVRTLRDGRMVLASVLNQRPDLILLDVRMPEMDGFEVCQQLKNNEKTKNVPIMFVSALQEISEMVKGFESGAYDYITKPFTREEVLARVKTQLYLESLRRELKDKNEQLQNEILERMKVEEELRQTSTVFDNTDEAIIITDVDCNIITVNKSFSLITGYEADEVIGKNPRLQQSGRHDEAFYRGMWEILINKGQWRGEIWNRRKNGELYPAWENITAVKNEQGQVTNYVAVLSDISILKKSEQHYMHLAHHDALTGLPNRLWFEANLEQSLQRAKRRNLKVGLLFLDLDHFKNINDTFGHSCGDKLLQEVAVRLKQCVRAEDTVARLGGDEFTIILNEISQSSDAAIIANKIINAIREPFQLDGQEVNSATSIGIGIYPDDAATGADLLKNADIAMYCAKEQGRDNYQFYTSQSSS